MTIVPTPRPVAGSVTELLSRAEGRTRLDKSVDSLSGSRFEQVTVDGQPCVVKYLGLEHDWLARALADRDCFALTMWRTGLLDALPACIDHTILGAAQEPDGTVALLMRDVSPWLVPPGSDRLPRSHHRQFLDHLAPVPCALLGFRGPVRSVVAGRAVPGPHAPDGGAPVVVVDWWGASNYAKS